MIQRIRTGELLFCICVDVVVVLLLLLIIIIIIICFMSFMWFMSMCFMLLFFTWMLYFKVVLIPCVFVSMSQTGFHQTVGLQHGVSPRWRMTAKFTVHFMNSTTFQFHSKFCRYVWSKAPCIAAPPSQHLATFCLPFQSPPKTANCSLEIKVVGKVERFCPVELVGLEGRTGSWTFLVPANFWSRQRGGVQLGTVDKGCIKHSKEFLVPKWTHAQNA